MAGRECLECESAETCLCAGVFGQGRPAYVFPVAAPLRVFLLLPLLPLLLLVSLLLSFISFLASFGIFICFIADFSFLYLYFLCYP